ATQTNFIGMKFLLIPLNIYTSSLVGYSLFDYTATLRKQSRQHLHNVFSELLGAVRSSLAAQNK
ncbi:hypothetical protein P7D71_21770, partial [Enterococcus raffinosus]|uniref:hypothetical protein n=1 Tax=Enterococcus raffinosus TaxID=71452 RepID=UPI0028928EBF